jgi:hypothetical protein
MKIVIETYTHIFLFKQIKLIMILKHLKTYESINNENKYTINSK